MDPSWVEAHLKARDVYLTDPDILPNTYLKYYLFPDYVVEHSNPDYTKANDREKHVFGECRKISEVGTAKETTLHTEVHAS